MIKEGPRSIELTGRYQDAGLMLKIQNTSMTQPKMDRNGRYLSTSHSGYGIGIESVNTIVKKYNGMMQIEYKDGIVTVYLMLMI